MRWMGTVTVFSSLMMRAKPRRPISVPMVKTRELMPVAAMRRPCRPPKAPAAATEIATAGRMLIPAAIRLMASTPITAASEPTDRSNSAASMVTPIPTATRPISTAPSSSAAMPFTVW
jgi:hypothetical protein